jgi:hypothetical protein
VRKESNKKQRLILRQKTRLRLIVAGASVLIMSVILLIYFNIAQVKEMKAAKDSTELNEKMPVDMNVIKLKVLPAEQRNASYKIANPLVRSANQQ